MNSNLNSIPILKLGEILICPIQIDLSDDQALLLQQQIMSTIIKKGGLGLLIDISGLQIVDSYMARIINDTAKMVGMIGVEVVVSGIRPHVAMTLIEMGKGLLNTQCASNLEHGIEKLKQKIVLRGDQITLKETHP